MTGCISNPPYNLRWKPEPFAIMDERFSDFEVPPVSNANFVFILSALYSSDKSAIILPQSVLAGGTKEEKNIRKRLIEKNYIEAVITCPERMFESTNIAVCILVLNKNKTNTTIELVDMSSKAISKIREQKGQFGGSSHTNRTYKKNVNVFTVEAMKDAVDCINARKNIVGYCKCATLEDVRLNKYTLLPGRYIELKEDENIHREYKDIVADINRIIKEKNACKLTINESLARGLGFDVEMLKKSGDELASNDLLEKIGAGRIEKDNYFQTSKNKNEFKFENTSKDMVSSILRIVLMTWRHHIFYLNEEENRYLAELRDALLPDLMSGKIDIGEEKI